MRWQQDKTKRSEPEIVDEIESKSLGVSTAPGPPVTERKQEPERPAVNPLDTLGSVLVISPPASAPSSAPEHPPAPPKAQPIEPHYLPSIYSTSGVYPINMAALPGYSSPEPRPATAEKMPMHDALNADPADVKAAESRSGTAPTSVVGSEPTTDHHAGAGPAVAGVAGLAGGAGLARELSNGEREHEHEHKQEHEQLDQKSEHAQQQRPALANEQVSRSYIKPSPVIANGSAVGSAPALPPRSDGGASEPGHHNDRTNTASPVSTRHMNGTAAQDGVNHPEQDNSHNFAKTAGAAGLGAGAGIAVGQFVHPQQHQQLQQQNQPAPQRGHVLIDEGVVGAPGADNQTPASPYGARPSPDSPVAHQRPLSRAGTLQRGANGGTIGRRTGTFGRGAGASIGTQPEEVMGRDDIHTRVENNERGLDDATLKKLQTMGESEPFRCPKYIDEAQRARMPSD